jgi:hypothetical protein
MLRAYVSIRQHMSAYVSICQQRGRKATCISRVSIRQHMLRAYVSIRQHMLSAKRQKGDLYLHNKQNANDEVHRLAIPHLSIRQHTSAYVSIRQHTSTSGSTPPKHTSAYVSIRQHTSAYVSIRQHTSVRHLRIIERLRIKAHLRY